ncbi:ICEBs1 excisionase [Massilimaliae timonensis]|uniref:ICEBs1 excisionase n=1 Tax=Massiliimalia timonensis TaxID=1987501 RepID=A0A8J6PIS5_9FIRM|nr:ICEBs1 excisionase [Massiliimalia timonensis]MBC8610790.1 ICEBs1 excisionase [Massiliimalia timonensis]
MKYYLTAPEVAEILGVSNGKAYDVIRNLNKELQQGGYITVSGKVPTKYFNQKFWGGIDEVTEA